MNWTDGVDLTLEQRRVINPTFDAAVQFGQTLENFSLLHAFNSDLSQRSKLIQFLKQAVHVITLIAVLVFIRRKVFFRPTL